VLSDLLSVSDLEEIEDRVAQMDVATLTRLMLMVALSKKVEVRSYSIDSQPEDLLALAKHYGIDTTEALSTPSPAGAARVQGDEEEQEDLFDAQEA
jgi:hypothetical protein